MVKSLFIGNLPWSITEDELKKKFEEHVKVEEKNAHLTDPNQAKDFVTKPFQPSRVIEAVKRALGG